MALGKIFFAVCLVASVIYPAAGYGFAGQWMGVIMAVITGLAWLLARKYQIVWLPFICLVVSVCLAVVGLLTGLPPWLMICGSGLALAVYDLLFLNTALGNGPSGEQTRRYETRHLQSLALALGIGLLMVFLGRLLPFQPSFWGIAIFVGLAVVGLDRVGGNLKKVG